jgi:hypothetical protein
MNNLIRHCFTLSQQQKVTSSKYLKDLGHAVVERTDGDDIIHSSTSEGIYDLTLGLSDKECWLLIALHGYDAAAITYGKAKEGAVEAHNFSAALSVTSLHSAKEKGVKETPAPTPILAQLVYSIGTSRVANDCKEKSDEDEEDDNGSSDSKHVAIDGMDILQSNCKQGAMLFLTALMLKRVLLLTATWTHDGLSIVCPLPRYHNFRPDIGLFLGLFLSSFLQFGFPIICQTSLPRDWH